MEKQSWEVPGSHASQGDACAAIGAHQAVCVCEGSPGARSSAGGRFPCGMAGLLRKTKLHRQQEDEHGTVPWMGCVSLLVGVPVTGNQVLVRSKGETSVKDSFESPVWREAERGTTRLWHPGSLADRLCPCLARLWWDVVGRRQQPEPGSAGLVLLRLVFFLLCIEDCRSRGRQREAGLAGSAGPTAEVGPPPCRARPGWLRRGGAGHPRMAGGPREAWEVPQRPGPRARPAPPS